MCLFSFPFDNSSSRRKESSSSSHVFKSNKHKPQGPITLRKVPRQPPQPPPSTPETTPKGPKLSPRRGKRGNVSVPLGATDCARRRRSGSPARSSSRARSSNRARSPSRGDKHGGSNRTSKEQKERKREPDMEPWKEDEGGIEERMRRMHLQHHYNKSDQTKAQPQPHSSSLAWRPGSDVPYPPSAPEAYHKGAGIQVRELQRESQPQDAGDDFHTEGFIQPEGLVWTWLKGGDGRYILVAAESSCCNPTYV